MNGLKYYIIAGEASGDLHGSLLVSALKQCDSNSQFRAWGGDLMQKQGVFLAKHVQELSIMGIIQVILKIFQIWRLFRFCFKDILAFNPDALILIDYSGFNLRVAEWASKKGIPVYYYISPQVWASRSHRVEKIRKHVRKLFVIFPFEKEFYKKKNIDVIYIGHPLEPKIRQWKKENPSVSAENKIVLLPGSRKQEVERMLPLFCKISKHFPSYQFVVGASNSVPAQLYTICDKYKIKVEYQSTYPLLQNAKAALVTSGTATLETALFHIPQVVCYKTNFIFYWIARQIIQTPYISIVNILAQKKVVDELIQNNCNQQNLILSLKKILTEKQASIIKNEYQKISETLLCESPALIAAQYIWEDINK